MESRVPARLIDINYSHEDSVETKRATASTTTSGCTHSIMYSDTPDGSLPYLFDSETAVQKDYFSQKIFCLSLIFRFPSFICFLSFRVFEILMVPFSLFSCSSTLSFYPLMYPLFNILPGRRKTEQKISRVQ